MVADTTLTPLKADFWTNCDRSAPSTLATQLYRLGFRQPTLIGLKLLSNVVDGFVGEAYTNAVHSRSGGRQHPGSVPQR